MNAPRRKQPGNRPRKQIAPKSVDLWRPVPKLSEPERIHPVTDPTAVLRSLGDPPLQGQGAVAEHYLAAVVARASGMATALAMAADLLAEPSRD